MKVSVDISPEYKEPYAVIYTDQMTDEIRRMIEILGANETPITALQNEEDLVVLQPKEIFMVRVLIHMGIGCVVYTIVAYAVGWIGGSATVGQGIIIAAIQLGVAFVIWFLFMRYYRNEAKKINDKIQAMKQ